MDWDWAWLSAAPLSRHTPVDYASNRRRDQALPSVSPCLLHIGTMSKKLTVCLVDDDAAVRNSFKLLMKSAGINFVSFGSAQEYLAGFEPKNVGCIILDVRMPGMSGVELHEILKQRRVHIPIIIL